MVEINRKKLIKVAVGNMKGGCGKSFTAKFLIEKLNYLGQNVYLTDTDRSQSTQRWVNNCQKLGRELVKLPKDCSYNIIDTAGNVSSALLYLNDADYILTPFLVCEEDLKITKSWINNNLKGLENKLILIPNRWENTLRQRKYLENMQEFAKKIGCNITSPIRHKPTHYEKIGFVSGSKVNVFENSGSSSCKAPLDLQLVSSEIMEIINK